MIRGILQFTPSIAFSYVLHRCESRDIRCRESFCVFHLDRRSGTEPGAGARERDGAGTERPQHRVYVFLGADRAGVR